MDDLTPHVAAPGTGRGSSGPGEAGPAWSPPAFQVISLDCEITAYAPDEGDWPLF